MDEQLETRFDIDYSFGAKQALGVLIAFVIVMIVANSATALLINRILDSNFLDIPKDNKQIAGALIVLRQLASLTAGSVLLFFYLKINFPGVLKTRILTDIGLVRSHRQWSIFAMLFGFLFSVILSRVVVPLFPPKPGFVPNPLLSETQTGNWIQYLTVFMVVCIAPATEELLFRGILYKGFSVSWGKFPAVILITILFVLLHDETLAGGYWLGISALIMISICLILARELSGSLIPPVLMHSGFNLAMVLPV